MALAIKVQGFDTIWDATIGAADANGVVLITGKSLQTNPNLEHANTAYPYSEDIEADFPPTETDISLSVIQSQIREIVTY